MGYLASEYHWLLLNNIFCLITEHHNMLRLEEEFVTLRIIDEVLWLQEI